jgi:hypothetical protein
LRKHLKLTQAGVFADYQPAKDRESKRAQLTNAENGRNKLQGPFLLELAAALKTPVETLHQYLNNQLPLENYLRAAELGFVGGGNAYKVTEPPRMVTMRVSEGGRPHVRALGSSKIDSLSVVQTLHELDGIDYGAAVKATQEIEQEAGDTFGLYVQARLKLRAEAGGQIPHERILAGPDVLPTQRAKKAIIRKR